MWIIMSTMFTLLKITTQTAVNTIPAMHDLSPATDAALLKETTPCKYSTYTTLYTQSLLNNSFKL